MAAPSNLFWDHADWQKLHESMDTKFNFSSAYHPQTDGQTERMNQVLEDMLRACALKHGGSWEKSLPFAEFSYNNSYRSSLKMAPFEALYGRKRRTPLYWSETGESQLFGSKIIEEAERQVQVVHENLKVAQSRQKNYVDTQRRELTSEEGDYVYLKVSPIRGLRRFKAIVKVTTLHRSVQDLGTERRGGLPARITGTTVRGTQHVPYITVEKVLEGTRGTVAT
jgi:hypothetical protein